MISKLLLIRKKDMNSSLADDLELSQFAKGGPLNVSPKSWPDEADVSHYGLILEGMKVKDLKVVRAALESSLPGSTLLDYTGDVESALGSVGLRINESV